MGWFADFARNGFGVVVLGLFLAGCGGGGSSPVATEPAGATPFDSTSSVAMATSGMEGIATVGKTYLGRVDVALSDSALNVSSFSVVNSSVEGAQPTIDSEGNLTWVPNEQDYQSAPALLRVMAKLSNDALITKDIPMDVRKERIVMQKTLSSIDQSHESDDGRYIFQVIKETAESTISGQITVIESYRSSGEFTWRAISAGTGYAIKVVDAPIGIYSPLNASPSAIARETSEIASYLSLKNAQFTNHPISPLTVGGSSLFFPNLSEKGSVIRTIGGNVYSSRAAGTVSIKFKVGDKASTEETFALEPTDTFWFGHNCSLVASEPMSCFERAKKKSPVILIHGFSGFDNALFSETLKGGNESTWGQTAKALVANGHPVFEMRWHSYMPFEDAAGALAKFGRSIANLTGKKPVVLAHSFGGIVSHLALQNKGREWKPSSQTDGVWVTVNSDQVFAKLITLNSPLSGINANGVGSTSFNPTKKIYDDSGQLMDVNFPRGVDRSDPLIYTCYAVTCAQAGAVFNDNLSFKELLIGKAVIDGEVPVVNVTVKQVRGTSFRIYESISGLSRPLKEGEVIANIQAGIAQKANNAPFLTVAGFKFKVSQSYRTYDRSYRYGDGLISIIGQAAIPQDFSDQAFEADLPVESKLKFETGTYPTVQGLSKLTLDQLTKGDCIEYRIDTRDYLICINSAHMQLTSTSGDTFPIAKYSGVDSASEVMPRLIYGRTPQLIYGKTYLAVDPEVFAGNTIETLNSHIRGRTGSSGARATGSSIFTSKSIGALTPIKANIWTKLINKRTGIPKHFYFGAESDSSGNFDLDIGSMLVSKIPEDAVLANYRISLKIEASGYQTVTKIIENLGEEIDLGEIDLSAPRAAPQIVSVTNPLSATVGQPGTFIVTGTDLPITATTRSGWRRDLPIANGQNA